MLLCEATHEEVLRHEAGLVLALAELITNLVLLVGSSLGLLCFSLPVLLRLSYPVREDGPLWQQSYALRFWLQTLSSWSSTVNCPRHSACA